MPICTYLDDYVLEKKTSNTELNELLDELRRLSHQKWAIEEREVPERQVFWRTIYTKRYTLYAHVSGCEYQVINFHDGGIGGSINTMVPLESVMNFIMGYINGRQEAGQLMVLAKPEGTTCRE